MVNSSEFDMMHNRDDDHQEDAPHFTTTHKTPFKEIRDSSLTAFPNLVADMNANEDKWDFVMGARQGSTSSKEQEGFVWDRNKFSLEEAYDFDDTQE